MHDGPLVSFLLQRALPLQERREQEEKRRKQEEQEEQEELNSLSVVPVERRTPQQNRRLADILLHRAKRKRKKRRKRRTSSRSLRGPARRRQRQWHARFAGFAGDVPFRAVFSSVDDWPQMRGQYGPEGQYSSIMVRWSSTWAAARAWLVFLALMLSRCILFECRQARVAGHHVLDRVVRCPFAQRQGTWSRQCRFTCSCSS